MGSQRPLPYWMEYFREKYPFFAAVDLEKIECDNALIRFCFCSDSLLFRFCFASASLRFALLSASLLLRFASVLLLLLFSKYIKTFLSFYK